MSTALFLLAIAVVLLSLAVIRNRKIAVDTRNRLKEAQVSETLAKSITASAIFRSRSACNDRPLSSPPLDSLAPVADELSLPSECPPQAYDAELSAEHYSYALFPSRRSGRSRGAPVRDTYLQWEEDMKAYGMALTGGGVVHASFVHGTFVGNDPFSMLRALQGMSPKLHDSLEPIVKTMMKTAGDFVAQDAGNFSQRWVRRFQSATDVPSSLFVWSSENTHGARLAGAIRLAKHLVNVLPPERRSENSRILLVGHSHAAQVFALLLHLIHAVSHANTLLKTASIMGEDIDALGHHLELLRPYTLDIVTLGSPVRYGWPQPSWPRLLHIINHRGHRPLAGAWEGILTTRDGDYLQQLGIAGSDLPALTADVRTINLALDEVLGPGWNPQVWMDNLRHRRRIHQGGYTLLVDYQDHSSIGLPNCISTNFGHAIYTRWNTMKYLTFLIQQHLYPNDALHPSAQVEELVHPSC